MGGVRAYADVWWFICLSGLSPKASKMDEPQAFPALANIKKGRREPPLFLCLRFPDYQIETRFSGGR